MQGKGSARNKIRNAAGVVPFIWGTSDVRRPLQNGTFGPISASGSNFNPRNIQYITVVEPDLKIWLPSLNSNKNYHFSKVS